MLMIPAAGRKAERVSFGIDSHLAVKMAVKINTDVVSAWRPSLGTECLWARSLKTTLALSWLFNLSWR
jgi:hypothetical protein